MRRAADLHWSAVSTWNWQRFLAGMAVRVVVWVERISGYKCKGVGTYEGELTRWW
jgi:hypothetical protein